MTKTHLWACIGDQNIREAWCKFYIKNIHGRGGNCRLDLNPNYHCPHRHIDIWEILQDTIPKRKKK